MKLEVGKKYVRRDGHIVKIVYIDEEAFYPFVCSEGNTYTEAGLYYGGDPITAMDLVSEYIEPTQGVIVYTEPTHDRMPASAEDGWVKESRLVEAEARVKELELEIIDWENDMQTEIDYYTDLLCKQQTELDALKPKPVTKSIWVNVYENLDPFTYKSRVRCDECAVNTIQKRAYVRRTDTTNYPDGTVVITYHKEEI